MKAQIKKWGTSSVIVLDPEFIKFYDFKVGDWLDLSDIHKIKKGGSRK